MNKLLILSILFCQITFSQEKEDPKDFLKDIKVIKAFENASMSKWQDYVEKQKNEEWIKAQAELMPLGTIFQKGWLGPRVRRSILPYKQDQWRVHDTIDLGEGGLLSILNIIAGIVTPFITPRILRERVFSNDRFYQTYEEALQAPVYTAAQIPYAKKQLDEMIQDETQTMYFTHGLMATGSSNILRLLGVDVPVEVLRVRLHYKNIFKIMMTKTQDGGMDLMIEAIKEFGAGLQEGVDFSFSDYLQLPVSIGINGHDGYSPVNLIQKRTIQDVKQVIYHLDYSDPKVEEAFFKLVNDADLTELDKLVEDNIVKLEMIKEGTRDITRSARSFDMFLIRAGVRTFRMESDFTTYMADGKKYNYGEIVNNRVRDRKIFSREHKLEHQFSALFPRSATSAEHVGFFMDYQLQYFGKSLNGHNINEVAFVIEDLLTDDSIFPLYEENYKIGDVQMYFMIRFTSMAIEKIFKSKKRKIWIALAEAIGIADPLSWGSMEGIIAWRDKHFDRSNYNSIGRNFNGKTRLVRKRNWKSWKESCYKYPIKCLENAREIANKMADLRSPFNVVEKIKYLETNIIESIKSDRVFLKMLINLVGQDQLVIEGQIRGKHI